MKPGRESDWEEVEQPHLADKAMLPSSVGQVHRETLHGVAERKVRQLWEEVRMVRRHEGQE